MEKQSKFVKELLDLYYEAQAELVNVTNSVSVWDNKNRKDAKYRKLALQTMRDIIEYLRSK